MPYQSPGPSETLKEARILQVRRERFTKRWQDGTLPFYHVSDLAAECECCHAKPTYMPEMVENGVLHPAYTIPLRVIDMEEGRICVNCFRADWTIIPRQPSRHLGTGTPATWPGSQRVYDGGIPSGEW